MKKFNPIMLTMLFDYVLESEYTGDEELAQKEQAITEEYSLIYSRCVHGFYNILYPVRFELMSDAFYTTNEESPCLKWFKKKCIYNFDYERVIDKKTLGYAIKEAIGMVKSDKEKDIQHDKQIEIWLGRLDEIKAELKKVNDKLSKHSNRKTLRKKKSLLFERSYLQRKINTKFSSRRVFGGKKLMLEINNAYVSALKIKAKKRNFKLEDTYLTEEEKAEVEIYKAEKKKEYRAKRYGAYSVPGDAAYHGNRYFLLTDDPHIIIFKPKKGIRIKIRITDLRGYDEVLEKILKLSKEKKIALTFKLNSLSHTLGISYDARDVYGDDFKMSKVIKCRLMGIDLNPDESGTVVVDWYMNMGFEVIDAQVYSIEELNNDERALNGQGIKSSDPRRKYFSNKRKTELQKIAISMAKTAAYYKCEMFVMENLKFDNLYNKNRSKDFNRLVNKMWNRTELVRMIEKECKLSGIKIKKVIAAYSSFVGNLVFRSLGLPDMCLSAFELTRRAFMLKYKYTKENEDNLVEDVESSTQNTNNNRKRKKKDKGIIFPDMNAFKRFGFESLDEFDAEIPDHLKAVLYDPTGCSYTLYDLYKVLGTSMVRVKLESFNSNELKARTFRFCSPKSRIRRIMFDGKYSYNPSSTDNGRTLPNGSTRNEQTKQVSS